MLTQNIDTGPDGDDDPTRPIASIQTQFTAASSAGKHAFATASANVLDQATAALPALPSQLATPNPQRFEGLAKVKPVGTRVLYFSEVLSDPNDPNSPTDFFITVDGDTPTLFDPSNPPAITTTQGSVEDWTIENRTLENHEFHIHQIHFLLLDQNGVPVAPQDQQMLDMVQVPYWSGSGPFPSVPSGWISAGLISAISSITATSSATRTPGMMAIIRVLPQTNAFLAAPEALLRMALPNDSAPTARKLHQGPQELPQPFGDRSARPPQTPRRHDGPALRDRRGGPARQSHTRVARLPSPSSETPVIISHLERNRVCRHARFRLSFASPLV